MHRPFDLAGMRLAIEEGRLAAASVGAIDALCESALDVVVPSPARALRTLRRAAVTPRGANRRALETATALSLVGSA